MREPLTKGRASTGDRLPLLMEPETLRELLGDPGLLLVDVGREATYRQLHLPGAVHLDYRRLVTGRGPAQGLLPDVPALEALFSTLGVDDRVSVVAYDDEGGGNAARLLWTLEAMGHSRGTLLNGGLHAWANEGHPLERRPVAPSPRRFVAAPTGEPVADADFIRGRLGDTGTLLLDARSREEYTGARRYARRAGRIPGAIHFEWTAGMDPDRNLRMRPAEELRDRLGKIGATPEREVVVYCQTHHRSSYSYWMLRVLGYPRVRGYPGSWSDWGNRHDTPVE